ncbi:hypothetical protein D3C80_1068500 [compost metagenome]
MISPMKSRPKVFLTCAAGTLPGRKPLSFIWGATSLMRASSFSFSSATGMVTASTRLRPSFDFSTTCMVGILTLCGDAERRARWIKQ